MTDDEFSEALLEAMTHPIEDMPLRYSGCQFYMFKGDFDGSGRLFIPND